MVTEVRCLVGHTTHQSRQVNIDLAHHGYPDLPTLPTHLHESFSLFVWDPDIYPVGSQPNYCPAQDPVSEAITHQGCWEPCETAAVMSCIRPGDVMWDFGAHVGWFSLVASLRGATGVAYEACDENARLLRENVTWNGAPFEVKHQFVHGKQPFFKAAGQIRLVKIDVEGGEVAVVSRLRKLLEVAQIDHLLVEISPTFGPGYGQLVERLHDWGYESYTLPDKSPSPAPFTWPDSLTPFTGSATHIDNQDYGPQLDLWFRYERADW